MAGLYDIFETSKSHETQGVDFEISKGVRFTLARAGGANKKYQQIMTKLMQPYQREFNNGTMDSEKMQDIIVLAFVKGCLLGWEGVTDRAGQPLEFNEGNALKLFAELPDLFFALNEQANKVANYRIEQVEEIAGKSEAT
jgi:hypothetical protein